jgi:hypothetical protein
MDYFKYFYNECLEEVLRLSKVLGYQQIRLIFLVALGDFLGKKINVGDFCSIANELYYDLNKPSDFYSNNESQKLGNALEDASEIEYYQENKDKEEANKKMYDAMIKNLREYFDKYKHLLEK